MPLSSRQLAAIRNAANQLPKLGAVKRRSLSQRALNVARKEVRRYANRGTSPDMRRLNALAREVLAEASVHTLRDEIARYAMRGSMSGFLGSALRSLGKVGKAVGVLLGRQKARETIGSDIIRSAIHLLEDLGLEVRIPESGVHLPGQAQPIPLSKAKPKTQPQPPAAPPQQPPVTPIGPQPIGPPATFPGNIPIDMTKVTGSSNVYAYGYDAQTATLRVQFLGNAVSAHAIKGRGHRGKRRARGTLGKTVTNSRKGPGPVYDYHNVPKRVFERFSSAPSKGGAVWDMLRVRGTIYGHKYDYNLVAASVVDVVIPKIVKGQLTAGRRVGRITYVPRKTVGPGMFRQRVIKQGSRSFRSILPSEGLRAGNMRSG